jgi:polysaccharide export outer membrane protein
MRLTPLPLLLLLGACASSAGLADNPTAVRVASELPPPEQTSLQPQDKPFLLGPYDSIAVEVFGATELNRSGMIDAAGKFSLPLVGEVNAAGQTTSQFAAQVAGRLRGRYMRDPQVSVQLTEARSQQVTIDGSVKQPGVYPVLGRTTLQQAIAYAHGTDEFAKLSEVVVFRTVAGQRMAALFDLKDIRQGAATDPEIYGNDVIVVGDNKKRRVFKDIIQTLPAFGVFTLLR